MVCVVNLDSALLRFLMHLSLLVSLLQSGGACPLLSAAINITVQAAISIISLKLRSCNGMDTLCDSLLLTSSGRGPLFRDIKDLSPF